MNNCRERVFALVILAFPTGCLFGETPLSAELARMRGLDPRVPIRVCGDEGQNRYVQRLRCAEGTVPSVDRDGNVTVEDEAQRREGPIVAYRVGCPDGTFRIFVQQTCWGKPTDWAPRGLRLLDGEGPR